MMRRKVRKLVLAFSTTTKAIEAERYFKENQIEGRLIPLPSSISAGCGLAWSMDLEQRNMIEDLLEQEKIFGQGLYEILLYEQRKEKNRSE